MRNLVQRICRRPINSPRTDIRSENWRNDLSKAANGPEADNLRAATRLFPGQNYHSCVKRVDQGGFRNPHTIPASKFPRPEPSITYGYGREAFNSDEYSAVHGSFNSVAQPLDDLFWPFLVVQVASQATGGNKFVATNKCAIGGSYCSRATRTLYCLLPRRIAASRHSSAPEYLIHMYS